MEYYGGAGGTSFHIRGKGLQSKVQVQQRPPITLARPTSRNLSIRTCSPL